MSKLTDYFKAKKLGKLPYFSRSTLLGKPKATIGEIEAAWSEAKASASTAKGTPHFRAAAAAVAPKPATMTATPRATAPAVVPGLVTAAEFRQSITPPTMTSSEFRKLTPLEQGKFCQAGNKVIDDPKPLPRKSSVANQLNREEWNALPHSQRNAFFAKGGKLID